MNIFNKLFNKKSLSKTEDIKSTDREKTFDMQGENRKKSLDSRRFEDNLRVYNSRKKEREQKHLEERLKEIFPRKISDIVAVDSNNNRISYAMDGMNNALTGQNSCYSLTNTIIDRMTTPFIGWSQCAIVAQNWLITRALTVPANDAMSPNWKLVYNEDLDIDNDGIVSPEEQKIKDKFLKDLEQDAIDFEINKVCKKANYIKKCFGYCLVVPNVEGADMSKPFNIDGIRRNSYKGMAVIEPMWITPQFDENSRNPINKDFYEPSSYIIAGYDTPIHKSWVIKLINEPVSDILKPVYYFGGIPLTQMIFERVYCAEKVANEAPMLAMTKRLLHIEGDLENAIANPELFAKRMEFLVENQDNFGYAVIPQDSNIGKMETSLTDFDQLIMTQYQLVASIAQMPVTKLMKVQLRGFDSSGGYEQDDYNQTLVDIQEHDYKPIIRYHNELICMSKYGEDINFNIVFNEIDSPSAKENADIRYLDTQRDVALVNAGIISKQEAREKLKNDENSLYTSISTEDFATPVIGNEEDIDNDVLLEEESETVKVAEVLQ